MVTCISFSASANVEGVTAGPEPAPVPNVGGAPGGAEPTVGVDCDGDDGGSLRTRPRHEKPERRTDKKLAAGVHSGRV